MIGFEETKLHAYLTSQDFEVQSTWGITPPEMVKIVDTNSSEFDRVINILYTISNANGQGHLTLTTFSYKSLYGLRIGPKHLGMDCSELDATLRDAIGNIPPTNSQAAVIWTELLTALS